MGVYNRPGYTKQSLESVIKNTIEKHNLIVVDDNSNTETLLYLMKLQNDNKIKLIRKEKTTWVTHVFNLKRYYACKEETQYIILLDNDVLVRPGWASRLIKGYEILKEKWKGKPIPILKGFNRGEEVYGEKFEFSGERFARTRIAGGLAWLMERKVAVQDVEEDIKTKIDIGFGMGMQYIDNRTYRDRLRARGFEDLFVMLVYPSLVDHVGLEGVHTSRGFCPRGSKKKGQFCKL